jgi:WD40 repeat protein
VAVSPDGRWALSGDSFSCLTLWDLATGRQVRTWADAGKPSGVPCVAFLHGDSTRALDYGENGLRLWDVTQGKALWTFQTREKLQVWAMAVSPDNQRILLDAVCPDDAGRVDLLLVSVRDAAVPRKYDARQLPSLQLVFVGGGRRAVSLDESGSAWVWDLRTGEKVGGYVDKEREHTEYVQASCGDLTADGRYAVALFKDAITYREVATGKEIWEHKRRGNSPRVMRVSPDGSVVVVPVGTGLDVLDGRTGKRLRTLQLGRTSTRVIAFRPGGKQVVVGGGRVEPRHPSRYTELEDNRWLELWDATTGKLIRELQPEVDPVRPIP